MDRNFATLYRPRTYSEVVGQEVPKSVLKNIAKADGIVCRSIFLKGSWGSGKCVAPDTIVRTNSGLRYARSLMGGEKFTIAMCDNGIHQIARNDNTHTYRIKTESGNVIRVTGNHPVLSWDRGFDFKYAADVQPGDILCRDAQPCPIDFKFDPEAYFIGLLLGDGCCTTGCRYETYDKELFENAVSCLDLIYGATYTSHQYQRSAERPVYWRIELSKECSYYKRLKSLGIIGHDAYTKDLPTEFFTHWNLSQQISLLQGVMDTDGSIDKNGSVDLTMASEKVVCGLAHVMHAMGIPTKLSTKCVMYKGQPKVYTRLHSQMFPGSYTDLLCTLSYKRARIAEASTYGQAKCQVFPGQADMIRDLVKKSGLKFTRKQRSSMSLNFNSRDEFTYFAAFAWQEYLLSQGVQCNLVLPNVLPDKVVSVTEEEVPYTVDVQCETMPVFYTDGLVTHNTTLSRIFAKSMNCEEFKKTGEVCCDCDSCKDCDSVNSQLYIEMDATVARSLDSVDALKARLNVGVPAGKRRVVCIDEIHAAAPSVLNALLKLVEDGVPDTIFIFASTEDILPTLKSRSLCLDITTVPPALMSERIKEVASAEGIEINDAQVAAICSKSHGHMRDAMSILQLFSLAGNDALRTSYRHLCSFFSACFNKSSDKADAALSEVLKYPIVDIAQSINQFLVACYTSEEPFFVKVRAAQYNMRLFELIYKPSYQMAISNEIGIELLLRDIKSKFIK